MADEPLDEYPEVITGFWESPKRLDPRAVEFYPEVITGFWESPKRLDPRAVEFYLDVVPGFFETGKLFGPQPIEFFALPVLEAAPTPPDGVPPVVTYDPPSGTVLSAPGRVISIHATDETEILRFMISVELAPDPDTGERVWEVVYNGARFSDKYAASFFVTNTLTSKLARIVRNGGFGVGENPRFEVILFDKAGNIATS